MNISKLLNRGLFYLFTIIIAISCTEYPDEFVLGEEFIESKTEVTLIDTFSVELSTTLVDTIETNGSGALLIGKYKDNTIGEIISSSYFQLGIPETNYMTDDEIFDSLSLVLTYNNYSFGDTLVSQSFSIYQLVENITYSYDNVITSRETFSYQPDPIGKIEYLPKPNNDVDTISIKLSDNLGVELFNLLMENSEIIQNDEDFVNYFNGLAIVPDNSESNAIIGFGSDIRLMLYTHRNDITTEEYYYQFDIYEETKQFNHYYHDFSITNLNALFSGKDELSAEELGGLAFIQGAVGLVIKVNFPSFDEILLYDRGTIMDAKLSIAPLIDSYKEISLPSELYLYQTSKINTVLDNSDYLSYATPIIDELYEEENYYSFDLTDFLKDEVSDNYIENKPLIITLPLGSLNNKFSRLIIDAKSKKTNLKIYYLSY